MVLVVIVVLVGFVVVIGVVVVLDDDYEKRRRRSRPRPRVRPRPWPAGSFHRFAVTAGQGSAFEDTHNMRHAPWVARATDPALERR